MEPIKLETARLILRPWRDTDAESLYRYSKDPKVGPAAGWPVHTSVEDSRRVIRDILSAEGTFAVVPKGEEGAVGSIGLMIGGQSNLSIPDDDGEIGYWIGVPYWGRGLIPEAVREMLRYGFEDKKLKNIWCDYFDGNEKSHRVQEKCGFQYQYTQENVPWTAMHTTVTLHVSRITREQWLEQEKQ